MESNEKGPAEADPCGSCKAALNVFALLGDFLLFVAENHAGALNSKYHREHGEQYREHKLQAVGQRECAAGDGQELRLHGKHERSQRHDEHEHHGNIEHLVVAAGIAEPCAHGQQAERGEQLVGGAEQRPHELVAGEAERNAARHGDERSHNGVREELAPAGKLFAGLACGMKSSWNM